MLHCTAGISESSPYGWRGDVSSDKDPVSQQSLDLVAPDPLAAQAMVPDTLSEKKDEEIAPLFEQEQMDTDFDVT